MIKAYYPCIFEFLMFPALQMFDLTSILQYSGSRLIGTHTDRRLLFQLSGGFDYPAFLLSGVHCNFLIFYKSRLIGTCDQIFVCIKGDSDYLKCNLLGWFLLFWSYVKSLDLYRIKTVRTKQVTVQIIGIAV
jgi:hypothetical protein